jgi:zinc transport system ATP-binding protein
MTNSAIAISDLFFFYDKTAVLEGVSFTIGPREFVAIFGPNGGGKTTLLHLMLGLLKPQRGQVLLLGEAPDKTRHCVGYVPQRLKLDRYFPITVLDVVMMGALTSLNSWGRYPKTTRALAEEALERVGMGSFREALFGSLSGGEAQRVLIARAILNRPQLLILDEPTAHVDAQGEQTIHALLKELNAQMAVVLVTHDLQTIIDKADRLLCVQKTVTALQAKEICEHFALGLYHTPLTSPSHFINLGKPPC